MPLPSFLRWLVPSDDNEPASRRIQEQINSTYVASSPTQEDWDSTIKNTLIAIVRLKYLFYNEDLELLCSADAANTFRTLTKLCRRLAMEILPPSDSLKKQCWSCTRILPATSEYFPLTERNMTSCHMSGRTEVEPNPCYVASKPHYNQNHHQMERKITSGDA